MPALLFCAGNLLEIIKKVNVLNKESSVDCTVVLLNQLKLCNDLHLITQEMFILNMLINSDP